jgi:hypothetical protein
VVGFAALALALGSSQLAPGATVQVQVSAPVSIGLGFQYTMRTANVSNLRRLCIAPGVFGPC